MINKDIQNYCDINNDIAKIAAHAMRSLNMSARGYTRTLKVARTIADLVGSQAIEMHHFTEALQYRPRLNEIRTTPAGAVMRN